MLSDRTEPNIGMGTALCRILQSYATGAVPSGAKRTPWRRGLELEPLKLMDRYREGGLHALQTAASRTGVHHVLLCQA